MPSAFETSGLALSNKFPPTRSHLLILPKQFQIWPPAMQIRLLHLAWGPVNNDWLHGASPHSDKKHTSPAWGQEFSGPRLFFNSLIESGYLPKNLSFTCCNSGRTFAYVVILWKWKICRAGSTISWLPSLSNALKVRTCCWRHHTL